MSLSINGQQTGFSGKYGVINKFGSTENMGKLANNPVSKTENRTAVAKSETKTVETQKITMEDFLSVLSDNLMRVRGVDNDGNKKDIQPLLDAFTSTIELIEDIFDKASADMVMGVIAQSVDQYGASEANMSTAINEAFFKLMEDVHDFGLRENFSRQLNAGLDGWGNSEGYGLGKALTDFYFNDQSDEKFTLQTLKVFQLGGLATHQRLVAHEGGPGFMVDYYSELEEEYYANGGNSSPKRVFYPEEAYDPVDEERGGIMLLTDQWYAASLQATAMADDMVGLRPVEKTIFITTTAQAIINGEIKADLTDEMQDKVKRFSQLKEQMKEADAALKQAWADSGITGIIEDTSVLTDEIKTASQRYNELLGQLSKLTDDIFFKIKSDMVVDNTLYSRPNQSSLPSIFSAYV